LLVIVLLRRRKSVLPEGRSRRVDFFGAGHARPSSDRPIRNWVKTGGAAQLTAAPLSGIVVAPQRYDLERMPDVAPVGLVGLGLLGEAAGSAAEVARRGAVQDA
jgi:hypothetical protein